MTAYLNDRFSVHAPGSQQYRDNWDKIFAKKKPEAVDPSPPMPDGPGLILPEPTFETELEEVLAEMEWSDGDGDWKSTVDYIRELALKYYGGVPEQVREFHRAFEQPINTVPVEPMDARVRLRLRLITEEYLELMESTGPLSPIVKEMLYDHCNSFSSVDPPYDRVDMVEFADALGDLDYVVEGTRLEFGIDGRPIAKEIHRSNMSKLVDGRPVYDERGKVAKPDTYSPADVAGELRKQGYTV